MTAWGLQTNPILDESQGKASPYYVPFTCSKPSGNLTTPNIDGTHSALMCIAPANALLPPILALVNPSYSSLIALTQLQSNLSYWWLTLPYNVLQ